MDTSIQGKGTLFQGPETWFNLHSGHTLVLKSDWPPKALNRLGVQITSQKRRHVAVFASFHNKSYLT